MTATIRLSPQQILARGGKWHEFLDSLTEEEAQQLLYSWQYWARPNQLIPDGMGSRYRIWLFRAGRGAGKTRAGAETTRQMIDVSPRIALVAPTAADVRDVMIEGDSGLISVFPSEQRPVYEPSKRRVTFHNGAVATAFSAEEPERLRGPQHHWAWIDEPASMPNGKDALDNLLLGLRLGSSPWAMITGTPKPVRWLRDISDRLDTISTTGSTYDNASNLAPGFIDDVLSRYEGTRLGRQELYAEWLDDIEGAIWTQQIIDETRIPGFDPAQPLKSINAWLSDRGKPAVLDRRMWRIVVGVDPPGETAECGIVVVAAPTQGHAGRDHAVVLEDASTAGRPEEWGARVAATARKWAAERVVVESNQGGDMVRATIHAVDPNLRVEKVVAKQSKASRAEPVSAMYERGYIHHAGFFPMLEAQMTGYIPGESKSPDRMDALVHAISSVLVAKQIQRASVVSAAQRRI